jgi:TolA-binding protein
MMLAMQMIGCMALTVFAQDDDEDASDRGAGVTAAERQAKQLYEKGIELIEYKQYERGLAMLNTVVRDNQGSTLAHKAHMAMGKHYLEQHKAKDALNHFMLLTRLLAPGPGDVQTEEEQSLYHEALFHAGLSYYESGQYNGGFPLFRRLTEVAGKTPWANKAYYYIGMSHYALKNWNKAIDALSLVGTEVEDTAEGELGRIEIGQRFYAKIQDADVPVMRKLGLPIKATIKVSSGDSETVEAVAIPGKKDEMLASVPTALGSPSPNDGTLQMVGGDTVMVTYVDDSTLDGQKGVPRTGEVRAVSTGTVGFYLGDYATPAYIAYPGQPQVVMLRDADLDTSPAAEKVSVTITSKFKVEAKQAAESDDLLDIFAMDSDEEVWKERDSITLNLVEYADGDGPVRSGQFRGRITLVPVEEGTKPDPGDNVLHTDELDELQITYTDEVHLYGDEPRQTKATVKVSGSVNSGVTADQYVVFEELLKSRKSLVEAEALAGLGDIYKDMGLGQRAGERAQEALKKVNPVIVSRNKLPGDLVEKAFKLKWESELLKDDFDSATATCLAFNRLYPESVLADQALMTLGRSLVDKREFARAVETFNEVLKLQNPISAAEAQFLIGDALQKKAEAEAEARDEHNSKWGAGGLAAQTSLQQSMGAAIAAYRKCYETFPDSSFAADALGKVVRYYVDSDNFALAADLLESVFNDYPDAEFLDEMLLLWAKVAFSMGDNDMAKAKLQQLIFDYPSSTYVGEAQKRLAALGAE